jgi:Flp pilus assembly protein TadG
MRRAPQRPSGATTVEAAFVYPVLFLLVFAQLVGAAGIFRYSQLASLAREGARYASVHGTQYAQEMNVAAPTPDQIFNNFIAPTAVGFDTTQMSYSITYNTSNMPYYTVLDSNYNVVPVQNTVTVTLTYLWLPEWCLGGITLSSTSVMPMTY